MPTLLDYLDQIPDPRRAQGRRQPLAPLLAASIMAMLAGHTGYRPIARFLRDNQDDLRRHLPFTRHPMPSHVTVRTVLTSVGFERLSLLFRQWAAQQLPEGELLAIDGKAIRSTCRPEQHDQPEQDFACLVSAYAARSGLVAGAVRYRSGHTSEVHAAQQLIAELAEVLDLRGHTVSLDALHCTKKRWAPSQRPAGRFS